MMAELKNYDIAGAAQQGYAFGNQLRQQREGEQRRNALADLAGQAYGAAPDQRQGLIQQAVATDPQAGLALDQGLAGADDRRNRTMVNMARMLTSAPEQARNGLYQRMRPSLEQFGLTNLPPQYDPTVDQAAQSIVQAYGGAGGGIGVQSTYVDGEGNRVAIMRDGSTQILGKNDAGVTKQTISITGPDGRPAQYTFDRRTASYVPAGQSMGGQQQPASSGAPVLAQGQGRQAIDQIAASANQMIAAGIPEAQVEQWAAAQMGGGTVSDGAPSAGNQFQTSQQVVPGPSPFVGQSPAEKAASETAARQQAEIAYLPQRQEIETQGALDRATQLSRLESAADTVSSAPGAIATMQQSVDSIDALLNSPNLERVVGLGSVNPLNLVPGTEGRGLIARADQIAGQSFLAAFNQLKGGGAITEKEGEAATKAMARLDRSQGIQDYRAALTELKSAITPAIERQRSSLARAQQTVGGGSIAAPVQRARNPQTGEVLELRNGQWVPAR